MELVDKKIKALEYALQYVPGGTDDNHSHRVLLDMLEELKKEPDGGNRTGSGN